MDFSLTQWIVYSNFIFAVVCSSKLKMEDVNEKNVFNSVMSKMIRSNEKVQAAVVRNVRVNRNSNNPEVISVAEPSESCVDQLSFRHCMYLKRHHACQFNRKRMQAYCHKTCGFCANAPTCKKTQYGCCPDGESIATGVKHRGCPEQCKDKRGAGFCKAMKRVGFCSKEGTNYFNECRKTCGVCRKCVDKTPKACKSLVQYDLCEKFPYKAINQCRKSCHRCGNKDPCNGFKCGKGTRCTVDHVGQPFCQCHNSCKRGDHFTGKVCGEDGKTYKTLCQLKQTHCDEETRVKVAYFGKCNSLVKRNAFYYEPWYSSCSVTKYGCCEDGKAPAKGNNGEGCPNYKKMACRDKSTTFCQRFISACGYKHNIPQMRYFCPKTCSYCV